MGKRIELTVDDALSGRRIDGILKNNMGLSGKIISRLKNSSDGIMLNGEKVKVVTKVKSGDFLTVTIHSKKTESIIPVKMHLDILYEDKDILAVNKPPLMPTHPSKNHCDDTLANGVMYYLKDKDFSVHIITRLDRETSGIVLIAKNSLAAQILTDDIKERRIHKEYIAIINGVPEKKKGVISDSIKRKENGGILREVAADGKEAITKFTVEKDKDNLSFVSLLPVTGRTHQLRVHMSYMGHPIYGDDMYGAPQKNERTRLHCKRIEFSHPSTKERIYIEAPVPYDIETLVE